MRRSVLILGIAALGALLLMAVWRIRERPEVHEILASGTVEATEVEVAAKIPERIEAVLVKEGDRVRKGDLLVRLETSELALQLKAAEARVAIAERHLQDLLAGAREQEIKEAEALLDQAKADLKKAERDWERAHALFGEGGIAESERDAAQAALENAISRYQRAKEGLAHLALAVIGPGDVVFVPNPAYPIHPYSVIIAGGDLRSIPLAKERDFFEDLATAVKLTWPQPKMLIISFPHNPTTEVVDLAFFEKVVEFAKEYRIFVVHDFAYADLCFDGYKAPSFMQAKGAKEVGVEFFSMSKSYSMPGWRVGFAVGNPRLIHALARIKSYLDYGIFQPIQIAAIIALNEDQGAVEEIVKTYERRRDTLVNGLERAGWKIEKPKGTMFVWGRIPEAYRHMGSLEFSKFLLQEAKVAVSPGIGFGDYGDEYVRFALVENQHRINQAVRGIRKIL